MKTILLALICFTPVTAAISQTNDWLFHYNFDGNALDQGANQNHGIIKGIVVADEDRFHQKEKSLSFDGSSGYILIPFNTSLNLPTKGFSFSFWLKLRNYHKTNYWDFIKSDQYAPIFCKSENDQTFQYRLCLNGSGYEFDGVRDNFMTGIRKTTGPIVTLGAWQMLTLTFDGDQIKMFSNGKLVDAQSYTNNFLEDTHPLVIGKDLPGALEYLDGSLDDFAVWTRPLAENEIEQLYNIQMQAPLQKNLASATANDSLEIIKGQNIILQNVHFVQSRAELLQTSYQELDRLVKSLKKHPTLKIEIMGHTDNVGDRAANIALSEKRAFKVSQYLMAHGIEKKRITTLGFGPDKPLSTSKKEEERKMNRRVEFRIIEDAD